MQNRLTGRKYIKHPNGFVAVMGPNTYTTNNKVRFPLRVEGLKTRSLQDLFDRVLAEIGNLEDTTCAHLPEDQKVQIRQAGYSMPENYLKIKTEPKVEHVDE